MSRLVLASLLWASAAVAADRVVDPRLAVVLPCARCARYYVAPDGDDDAIGDAARPWRTLQHAADRVSAGDVVQVRAGRYRGLSLTTSGREGAPIWFVAEPGAIITSDNPESPDGINLEGASWVGVAGFRIQGAGRAGIRAVEGHHVVIAGNQAVDNQRWGIFTGFCDDLVIEDNEAAGSRDEHGIYVSNSGDRPIIRRNLIHDNAQAGIHMNGDASMGGDGIISEAVVDSNVIHDVGRRGAAGINADGVQRSVFRNNLIYRAHATGIALYRIDGAGGSKDNVVSHNTIVVASDGRFAFHLRGGSTGVVSRNNIWLNDNPAHGAIDVVSDSLAGLSSDYNAVIDRHSTDDWETIIDLATWRKRTGQDEHSIVAGPETLFADGSFTLRADSAARDAGTKEGGADLLGHVRPQGGAPDMGALELCVSDPCARVEPPRATAILAKLEVAPPPAPATSGGCAGCALDSPLGSSLGSWRFSWVLWSAAALWAALRLRRRGDSGVSRRR